MTTEPIATAPLPGRVVRDDVVIVVLSGKVETLGRIVEPYGVIYYAAGEPHGMRNAGDGVARYLVFEFHAPRRSFRNSA